MVKRLTECIDSHLLDNGETVSEYSLNSNIKFNQFSCMDIPKSVYNKLGILEDILEQGSIETVEELKQRLELAHSVELLKDEGCDLSEYCIIPKKDYEKLNIENFKLIEDDNTWKKACELACKECNKLSRYDEIIDELNFSPYTSEYFYQQANDMHETVVAELIEKIKGENE